LKTPFKITFKREIDNNISDEEILNNFIINLKIKSLNTFNKRDNKLTASNNMKSFWDFNKPWEGEENVTIKILKNENKKDAIYVLDFSGIYKDFKKYGIVVLPFVLIVFYLIGKLDPLIENFGLFFTVLFILFGIIGILIIKAFLLILRHRNIFRNTMKYGAGNIKYYNWDKIMKTKTDKELKEIINGKSNYSDRVIIFAKKEYKKRHSENKNID